MDTAAWQRIDAAEVAAGQARYESSLMMLVDVHADAVLGGVDRAAKCPEHRRRCEQGEGQREVANNQGNVGSSWAGDMMSPLLADTYLCRHVQLQVITYIATGGAVIVKIQKGKTLELSLLGKQKNAAL